METAHELAVYIDRFHNLDLFQQGYATRIQGKKNFMSLSFSFQEHAC
jgi:hypothetical protein